MRLSYMLFINVLVVLIWRGDYVDASVALAPEHVAGNYYPTPTWYAAKQDVSLNNVTLVRHDFASPTFCNEDTFPLPRVNKEDRLAIQFNDHFEGCWAAQYSKMADRFGYVAIASYDTQRDPGPKAWIIYRLIDGPIPIYAFSQYWENVLEIDRIDFTDDTNYTGLIIPLAVYATFLGLLLMGVSALKLYLIYPRFKYHWSIRQNRKSKLPSPAMMVLILETISSICGLIWGIDPFWYKHVYSRDFYVFYYVGEAFGLATTYILYRAGNEMLNRLDLKPSLCIRITVATSFWIAFVAYIWLFIYGATEGLGVAEATLLVLLFSVPLGLCVVYAFYSNKKRILGYMLGDSIIKNVSESEKVQINNQTILLDLSGRVFLLYTFVRVLGLLLVPTDHWIVGALFVWSGPLQAIVGLIQVLSVKEKDVTFKMQEFTSILSFFKKATPSDVSSSGDLRTTTNSTSNSTNGSLESGRGSI